MTVIVNEVELIPEPEPQSESEQQASQPVVAARPAEVMTIVRHERERRFRTWAH